MSLSCSHKATRQPSLTHTHIRVNDYSQHENRDKQPDPWPKFGLASGEEEEKEEDKMFLSGQEMRRIRIRTRASSPAARSPLLSRELHQSLALLADTQILKSAPSSPFVSISSSLFSTVHMPLATYTQLFDHVTTRSSCANKR